MYEHNVKLHNTQHMVYKTTGRVCGVVDTNLAGDSEAQSKSVMLLESSDTKIGQLKVRLASRF